jgi:hypothetical protein
MLPGNKAQTEPVALPLQNAVLCAECECITMGRSDACPVCGSRSLCSMARLLGGAQQSSAELRKQDGSAVLYDVEIAIELKQAQPAEMSNVLENIAAHIGPWLVRGQGDCHIDVRPVPAQAEKQAA